MAFGSSFLGLFLVIFLTFPQDSECNLAAKRYRSTCDTNPSEIHLTKDEYDHSTGILTRTCEENVAVNKCEGECASSIYPSALNSVGFHKECHCCRESRYRERNIILGRCYDSDGTRLTGTQGSMKVKIREPMDCQCLECGH
eukprot:01132.XXX_4271_3279_1 [CDS] Oithona nana genome sequencing.